MLDYDLINNFGVLLLFVLIPILGEEMVMVTNVTGCLPITYIMEQTCITLPLNVLHFLNQIV